MISYHLSDLENNDYVKHTGSNKKGKWVVINKGSERDE